MEELKSFIDSYSRHARLFPALLTVFAPLLTALAWFPELVTSNIGSILFTLATSCGLLYAGASYARTKGKAVEARLLRDWGGWPTTYLLRHSSRLDSHTRGRYHQHLGQHVPGLTMPAPADEQCDPQAADDAYISAVKWLKEHVRETAPMADKENAQYGFRRNMRGMRALGLLGAFIALIASLSFIGAEINVWPSSMSEIRPFLTELRRAATPQIWGVVAVDVLFTFGWAFVVTDTWVKAAAEQYAEALLATCDR